MYQGESILRKVKKKSSEVTKEVTELKFHLNSKVMLILWWLLNTMDLKQSLQDRDVFFYFFSLNFVLMGLKIL